MNNLLCLRQHAAEKFEGWGSGLDYVISLSGLDYGLGHFSAKSSYES